MHHSDQTIIEGIRQRNSIILKHIYSQCYPYINNLVRTNSGELEDVQDVFQDCMVILYKKLKEGDIELQCSFNTYLYSICKRLWLKKLQTRRQEESAIRDIASTVELSEDDLIRIYDEEEEKKRKFQKHFLSLKEECQTLLRLFLKRNSLKEIADVMGFKTEKYAKLRKFLCKEELKRRILNDPECKQFI
ncbi:MAG: sigma-70 family RNA polymerase sigma factor [Bacteroidales bacterium]|nr:sigma-70 family RNA polymerase sigma factor [Bacteroidales bacterium]